LGGGKGVHLLKGVAGRVSKLWKKLRPGKKKQKKKWDSSRAPDARGDGGGSKKKQKKNRKGGSKGLPANKRGGKLVVKKEKRGPPNPGGGGVRNKGGLRNKEKTSAGQGVVGDICRLGGEKKRWEVFRREKKATLHNTGEEKKGCLVGKLRGERGKIQKGGHALEGKSRGKAFFKSRGGGGVGQISRRNFLASKKTE